MADVIIWMGPDGPRNIEEMTRDELIEVIRCALSELNHYQAPGMARAYALGKVEMWKRGING